VGQSPRRAAFYANGKRTFDMDLGNVRGAIPIHDSSRRQPVAGREIKADADPRG
jgi:hypothetical protein